MWCYFSNQFFSMLICRSFLPPANSMAGQNLSTLFLGRTWIFTTRGRTLLFCLAVLHVLFKSQYMYIHGASLALWYIYVHRQDNISKTNSDSKLKCWDYQNMTKKLIPLGKIWKWYIMQCKHHKIIIIDPMYPFIINKYKNYLVYSRFPLISYQ